MLWGHWIFYSRDPPPRNHVTGFDFSADSDKDNKC